MQLTANRGTKRDFPFPQGVQNLKRFLKEQKVQPKQFSWNSIHHSVDIKTK